MQARIRDLLRDHRKIEAIKLLREETGCGLAEAKKTIDAIPQSI
ncbi:ribosomal protein L7/L12 [Croceicoccus estronivorus]|nr:ribosomal protein L7/L12 [Croceicoccus estronivorus]